MVKIDFLRLSHAPLLRFISQPVGLVKSLQGMIKFKMAKARPLFKLGNTHRNCEYYKSFVKRGAKQYARLICFH